MKKAIIKKAIIVAIIAVAIAVPVTAETLIDMYDGQGVVITATPKTISFTLTMRDGLLLSVPYNGRAIDNGVVKAAIGDTIVGELGVLHQDNRKDSVEVMDANSVTFTFFNPSTVSKPEDIVFIASKNGDRKQFLCFPFELNRVHYARRNTKHPLNTQHVTMFRVQGESVNDAVAKELVAAGWQRSYKYHLAAGRIKKKLGAANLASGEGFPTE